MNLKFLGAAHEVTGSCTLLTVKNRKILIDCGMEQGPDLYENCSLPIAANDIDFILLTHAHIDHAGKLPALTAAGFKGKIYATVPTCKLCRIMLLDSAHIQESEAKWRNRKAQRAGQKPYVPLYTVADAENTATLFSPCNYQTVYKPCEGISFHFNDSGHLLGSASISISVKENGEEKTIVFSGDIGNTDRPILRNPISPEKADYVVIESTYGDRLHGERPDYKSQLTAIIQATLDRGGNLVIPSFAVGRTQELLFLIREIKDEHLIKNHDGFPVYVDSPLANAATKLFDRDLLNFYDDEMRGLIESGVDVLHFNGLHTAVTSEESIAINTDKTPKVILSASGMCEAGRIRHHLKHNLWREDSTVLFVGYQAEGTLGRKLVDGADSVRMFGEEIRVNCHIESMKGISGHADRDMLIHWLSSIGTKPETVFVNHGDDTVCDDFGRHIEETLHISAIAPYNGSAYDLQQGICTQDGNRERLSGKEKRTENPLFEKLLASARRLLHLAENSRKYSNKDIAKITSQIESLCDKWEK